MELFHLYFDDSGSRRPDHTPNPPRSDGIDSFALGGVLVNERDIASFLEAHRRFSEEWGLTDPLHSTRIRGRRKAYSWLATDPERERRFLAELESFLLQLPVMGIACVVDRPGYVARYAERYGSPWLLCKTAFAILIERAAKYAQRNGGQLQVFFEESGKGEDRDIVTYVRLLKSEGMPFDAARSEAYEGLRAEDFRSLILGEPHRVTKKVPMMQVADLMLFPMVKGGYDPTYAPYAKLRETGRIIDALLTPDECASLGIKYSCFDRKR